MDNPYDLVLLVKLARLACLGVLVSAPLYCYLHVMVNCSLGVLLMGRLLGHRGVQSALDGVHGIE